IRSALDPREVVNIVELGSATGRFGYYLLVELERLRRAGLKVPHYRLVLTDCVDGNVEFLRRHPYLESHVREGRVDFARFDAEHHRGIELIESGATLDAASLANPLVVVANYVFDGLPQDAFRVAGDEVAELVLTLESDRAEEPDPTAPELLGRLHASFSRR